jgi:hypothetical protein
VPGRLIEIDYEATVADLVQLTPQRFFALFSHVALRVLFSFGYHSSSPSTAYLLEYSR